MTNLNRAAAIWHHGLMEFFDDREDVEEWLEPLGYDAFWRETAVFCLGLPDREDIDAAIARGELDTDCALYALKGMARLELIQRFGLKPRDIMPWYSLH